MWKKLRKSLTICLVFLTTIVVSACESGPASDGCLIWSPIRPEAADVDTMSGSLVGQILTHNEKGKKLCGWKSSSFFSS